MFCVHNVVPFFLIFILSLLNVFFRAMLYILLLHKITFLFIEKVKTWYIYNFIQ